MPSTIQLMPKGVIKKFTGFLSGEEFAASAEAVARHPDFDSFRYIINDFQEVTGNDIAADDIERVAVTRFGSMQTNPNLCVVVVTQDPKLAALADFSRNPVLVGSQETVVFASVEDAMAWLERRPDVWTFRPRSL